MKYNRFLPLIVPMLALVLLEVYYFKHSLIYVTTVITLLALFFAIRQFLIAGNSSDRWYNYFISPAVLLLGSMAFSTMVVGSWLVQILLIGVTVWLYYYLRMLYVYLIHFNLRQKEGLKNFSTYGNFLSFYFIISSLYGIRAFLDYDVWPLMLIFLVATLLIIYQLFWINGVKWREGSFYILLLTLVLTELAWATTFLTLSFYILGLIIAIAYYILTGLTRFYLQGELDKKIVKSYLIFGLTSILIVLLSARWFET
jgi:hypothetical protein